VNDPKPDWPVAFFDAYTCVELTALLDRHGMNVIEVWGGPDRAPYSRDSRRLVLLAERGKSPA
jgi:hypothetical protein